MLYVQPRYVWLAFLLGIFKPLISINGVMPFVGRWGDNQIPLAPGRYQVEVWLPYLFWKQMGRSATVVDVAPGQAVRVVWTAPLTVFGRGRWRVEGAAPGQTAAAAAGWFPDPTGRFAQRYFNGSAWTEHVVGPVGPAIDHLVA